MLKKLPIFSSAGEERRDFIAHVREERQSWKSVCDAANWKDPELPGFPAWRRRISWSHFWCTGGKENKVSYHRQWTGKWQPETTGLEQESKKRTLFLPPLSSSAATTNFGSRLLIEFKSDIRDWIGVGHCSEKIRDFFFPTRYFSIIHLFLASSGKQTKWGVPNTYWYLF